MTLRRPWLVLIALLLATFSNRAQEVIFISFEEFPTDLGPTGCPPFVKHVQPGWACVADNSTSPLIQAPDGQKYLRSGGDTSIRSPNGQLISSYSLLLYLPNPGSSSHLSFGIGGQGPPVVFDTWQRFEGTFGTPQTDLKISAFVFNTEGFPTSYYVDAIQFVTVPEPAARTLFGLGAIAIFLLDHARRKTNLPG